jgi:hypothetical protein
MSPWGQTRSWSLLMNEFKDWLVQNVDAIFETEPRKVVQGHDPRIDGSPGYGRHVGKLPPRLRSFNDESEREGGRLWP